MRKIRHRRLLSMAKQFAMFLFAVCSISAADANPVLNNIAAGNVTVQQSPNVTQVNQSSQSAIINWNSFNIGANQATHFQQPTNGVALNRINPQQGASQIFGQLTATGQIILVNQAGIFFGPSAQVNVGGIIASTTDITNQNFLAGNYIFDQPSTYAGASITNEGSIIAAENGLVALLGPVVRNDGLIQAQLGNIVLASGNEFTVSFASDPLVSFAVTAPATNGSVTNTGTLTADGGKILMTARAAQGVLDNVIDMQGVVQANSVDEQNGEIILDGGDTGFVNVEGVLEASGLSIGQTGGTIKILGENILVQAPTTVNVSGDAGGGEILVGGNFHGGGPEQNSLTTTIASGSFLLADAISNGNGGQVAVWSNDDTQFQGTISAKGGAQGGNGGYVETSGSYLNVNGGSVNTLAPAGKTGTWLLDPTDITIDNNSETNATYGNGIYQPTDGTSSFSDINVTNLIADLNSNNVLITTNPLSGAGATGLGDINVNAAINWSSATTLELSAYHTIFVNAAISNSAGGSLTLRADNSGTGIGTINGLQSFNNGSISFTGNNSVVKAYYNPVSFPTPDNIFNNVTVSGTGSSFTAYMLVNSQTELQNISNNLTGNYALGTNLTLTGTFTPIGNPTTPFMGSFDGQNYTISNLTINSSDPDVGLFEDVGNSSTPYTGEIQNIVFINPSVQSSNTSNYGYVGTVTGELYGNSPSATYINNVSVVGGTVIGSYDDPNSTITDDFLNGTGGLVGFLNNGIIAHSSNSATVKGVTTNTATDVGGMAGLANNAEFLQDSNAGTISSGRAYEGGIVGLSEGTLTVDSSYNIGAVSGGLTVDYPQVGGLVGGSFATGTISNSYNAGPITAYNGAGVLGGLIGLDYYLTISNSYNAADGVLNPGANAAGGLVGNSIAITISNSWNAATITALNGVGGLIWGTGNGVTITNSYNTGTINANGDNNLDFIGGLAASFTGSITNSYNSGAILSGGNNWVGGLVGILANATTNTITNSHNTGSINDTGESLIGGLVGNANDEWGAGPLTITGSYNTGNISSKSATIGGLVAFSNVTTILNSYNTGTLTTTNDGVNHSIVGGIVGDGSLTHASGYMISNSYNSGNIVTANAVSGDIVGGLVGDFGNFNGNSSNNSWNEIQNSYNSGNISATSSNAIVGGLVGITESNNRVSSSTTGIIQTSYNSGTLTVTGSGSTVGGLVGEATVSAGPAFNNTITDSYNVGALDIQSDAIAGGIIGVVDNTTINNVYASGKISTTGAGIGGFAGLINSNTNLSGTSFWDSTSENQTVGIASGSFGGSGTETAGCFTGSGCLAGSAQLDLLSTYSGWSITATPSSSSSAPAFTWFIFNTDNGETRPMLMMENTTTIANGHELQMMGATLGASYTLANNIDLTNTESVSSAEGDVWGGNLGNGFVSIGESSVGGTFSGSLNGQMHVINNLTINQIASSTTDGEGLFSAADGATLENLGFTNVTINSNSTNTHTGTLIGDFGLTTAGTISDVFVTNGNVNQTNNEGNLGGLVGNSANSGNQINDVSFSGSLSIGSGGAGIGGLVGENQGSISNAYAIITLNSGGNSNEFGGLVGGNNGTLQNVYAAASLSDPSGNNVGYLVGYNSNTGTILNGYCTTAPCVGSNSGTITGGGSSLTATASSLPTGFASTDWALISGESYPFLTFQYQGITGTVSNGASSETVALAQNGSSVSSILNSDPIWGGNSITQLQTDGSGNYFALLDKTTFATTTPLLIYLDSGATQGNTIALLTNDTDTATVNITANTVDIHAPSATVTNSELGIAAGSISDSNILYSVSGAALTLSGSTAFNTESTSTYTIDGAFTAGTGAVTFNGPVNINTTSVTSNSAQTFNNTVSLNEGNTTFNASGHTITFAGAVSGIGGIKETNSNDTIALSAANTFSGATLVNAGTLELQNNSALGSTPYVYDNTNGLVEVASSTVTTPLLILNGGALEGTGTSSFISSIALAANSVIKTSGSNSDVFTVNNLGTSITGTNALTLQGAGTIVLAGNVNVSSLTSNVGTATLSNYFINTTGAQTYNGAVTLLSNPTLTGTGSGAIDFENTVDGGYSLSLQDPTGGVIINGNIGSGTMLTSLTIGSLNDVSPVATSLGNVSISTQGNQSYYDPVQGQSGASATLLLNGTGGINFNSTVDGAFNLTLLNPSQGGTVFFNANVGGNTPLTSLTIGTSLASPLAVIGTSGNTPISITTTGNQTYFDGINAISSPATISGYNLEFDAPIIWSDTFTLNLTAQNYIYFNNAGGISATAGSVVLSTPNNNNNPTIGAGTNALGLTPTSLSGGNGNISVVNFELAQGEFYENSASLPTFSVADSFKIDSGSVYNGAFNAEFVRLKGTTSINSTSYSVVPDVFGLQGIATMPALSSNYALTGNIDASTTINWNNGAGFIPIAYNGHNSTFTFTGNFNGQNYSINDLYINLPASGNTPDGVGLIGNLNANGALTNITLNNVNITGQNNVGGAVGYFRGGTINGVTVTGTVSGLSAVGGIVGFATDISGFGANISNSAADVVVNGVSLSGGQPAAIGGAIGLMSVQGQANTINNVSSNGYVVSLATSQLPENIGGLIGAIFQNNSASVLVENSFSDATVIVPTGIQVGGLVGVASGAALNIQHSWFTGSVSATSDLSSDVGGLVGTLGNGTLLDSYSNATVQGISNVGGLVGNVILSSSLINQSYSEGSVSGLSNVGGLIGYISGGEVENSYSGAHVTASIGESGIAAGPGGGFIGYIDNSTPVTVTTNYSSGAVTGTGGFIGGYNTNATINSSKNYWDMGTSGQSTDNDPGGVAGLTTANALLSSSYVGWDINTSSGHTWYEEDGYTRPILQSEYSTTINNAHQLQLINIDPTASYQLTGNVDASGTSNPGDVWATSVGNGTGFDPIARGSSFTGSFNGNGYVINNVYMAPTDAANTSYGLFSVLGSGGSISDVGIVNGTLTTNVGVAADLGLLAGSNTGGTISNVFATGNVSNTATTGAAIVGGLIGLDSSGNTLSNSYSSVNVANDSTDSGSLTGGFIGELSNLGTIQQAYSMGSVSAAAGYAGGFAGENNLSFIAEVYSTGAVPTSGATAGGLVGLETTQLVGRNFDGETTISLWDINTSGTSTGIGAFSPSEGFDSITGLTTAASLTSTPYTNYGWDISSTSLGHTWYMTNCNSGNCSTRPILQSEYSTNINTAHQLQMMNLNLAATYTLTGNIDANNTAAANVSDVWAGHTFTPIANGRRQQFTGTLNGQFFTISNLNITQNQNLVGLFALVGDGLSSTGSIENLTIKNATIDNTFIGGGRGGGVSKTGTVAGQIDSFNANEVVMDNVSIVGGTVSAVGAATNIIGGVVGYEDGSGAQGGGLIENVSNNAKIDLSSFTGSGANATQGGIAGEADLTTLMNVSNSGEILGNQADIGGLVGYLFESTLSSGYNVGLIQSNASSNVGGLVGVSDSSVISLSYNEGSVLNSQGAGSGNFGGLVGYVTGVARSEINNTPIANSYNLGVVIANGANTVGGLVGDIDEQSFNRQNLAISTSYNTGFVTTGGQGTSGQLIGATGVTVTNTNNYYDSDTVGSGEGGPSFGTGLTNSQMMDLTNFTGFSNSIWGVATGETYPYQFALNPFGTPQVISGTMPVGVNNAVAVAANGGELPTLTTPYYFTTVSSAQTGNNSFFYLQENPAAIPINDVFVVYLTSTIDPSGSNTPPAAVANVVSSAWFSGAGSGQDGTTGLTGVANTISISDIPGNGNIGSGTIAAAIGNLGTTDQSDFLFSASGSDLTIGNSTNTNVNLVLPLSDSFNITSNMFANQSDNVGLQFNGPVTVISNATIEGAGTGVVDFENTLDGGGGLSIQNPTSGVILNGNVGSNTPLASLTIGSSGDVSPAATTIGNITITTSGGQTYYDPISLSGPNVTFSGTGSGALSFSTIDGAANITMKDPSGGVILNADIGDNVNPLSLTIGAPGDTSLTAPTTMNTTIITTTGNQTFYDPIHGDSQAYFFPGGNILFNSTIDSANSNGLIFQVEAGGTTTFVGDIGANSATPISINLYAGTGTTFKDSNVEGSAYIQGVPVIIDSSNVTFNNLLSGANNFTFWNSRIDGKTSGANSVTFAGGGITFSGTSLGAVVPLASVTANASLVFNNNTNSSVTTTSGQTYNDSIGLSVSNMLFKNTGSGAIDFEGSVNGGANMTVIDPSGGVTINNNLGLNTPLNSLTIGSSGDTSSTAATNLGNIQIYTSGNQTYYDPILGESGAQSVLFPSGNVLFNNTIDGLSNWQFQVSLQNNGTVTFNGDIGTNDAISAMQVQAGSIILNNNNIIGGVSGNVELIAPITINTTSMTLDGATIVGDINPNTGISTALTLADNVFFAGNIGNLVPFASIDASTATTSLGSGNLTIATTGAQSYNFITDFGGTYTFNATAGDITFASNYEAAGFQNSSIVSSIITNIGGGHAFHIEGGEINTGYVSGQPAGSVTFNNPVVVDGTSDILANGSINLDGVSNTSGASLVLSDVNTSGQATTSFNVGNGAVSMTGGGTLEFVGSQPGDTLTGPSASQQTWNINGRSGNLMSNQVTFSNIAGVIGSNLQDTFNFSGNGNIAVNGGTAGATINTTSLGGSENITLTGAAANSGLAGTANLGLGSFTNINTFNAGNNVSNSVTGIRGGTETWSVTGANAFSVTANSKSANFTSFPTINGSASGGTDTFNFASSNFGGTINGGANTNTFNFSNSTIGATIVGGNGTNTFNFAANKNYSGSITSGTGTNIYVFGDNSTYTGTLDGTNSSSSTINLAAYTTPVTIDFSSGNNGTIMNNANAPIVTFTNFTSATGNESGGTAFKGTIQFPTSPTANVVSLSLGPTNEGVLGAFSDPFAFIGFNTLIGQSSGIDQFNLSGFSLSGSGQIINGIPFFYSGFNVPQPSPTPTPTPTPAEDTSPTMFNAQIISAIYPVSTSASSGSSSGSGGSSSSGTITYSSSGEPIYTDPVTTNITTIQNQQVQLDASNQPTYSLGCQ